MKIGMFSTTFLPQIGGIETFIHHLSMNLQEIGHEVHLFLPWRRSGKGIAVPYLVHKLFPYSLTLDLSIIERQFSFIRLQLARAHRKYQFDVWHVHGAYPAGYLFYPLIESHNIPAVLTSQGADIQKYPELGYGYRLDPIIEMRTQETVKAFTRLVPISTSIQKGFEELGADKGKIHVIPNGVDLDRFNVDIQKRKVRKELGIEEDEFLILAVGRNHPKKGFDYLIQAMALLRSQTQQRFRLAIVGRGTEELRSAIEREGVRDLVITIPPPSLSSNDPQAMLELPDLRLLSFYKTADVFVTPSLIEGFGIVTIEAMAAGLPIVATKVAGTEDIIHDGKEGILVEAGSPEALANAFHMLLENRSLREKMARNARLNVKEYDWKNIAQKYSDVYDIAIISRLKT